MAVGWKSEQAHDHDPVVALFETCVEYYSNLGPDTADLGMGKAIFLWNGLEDRGDLDELLNCGSTKTEFAAVDGALRG